MTRQLQRRITRVGPVIESNARLGTVAELEWLSDVVDVPLEEILREGNRILRLCRASGITKPTEQADVLRREWRLRSPLSLDEMDRRVREHPYPAVSVYWEVRRALSEAATCEPTLASRWSA